MKKMRLDRILSNSGYGSRKEVKALIKSGIASVSGEIVKDPAYLVNLNTDTLVIDGEAFYYQEFHYLMMNKPAGVITATWDRNSKTVLDLLTEPYNKIELFPVGRLDKDTEGLLLITNDGKLAHRLLSPKKKVPKTYYVEVSGMLAADDIDKFSKGIQLEEDFITLPAELEIIEAGSRSKAMITIYEGKFHQVKRMFEAVGKSVEYLKRISMGSLYLDESLPIGTYRKLTETELKALMDLDG